MTNLRWAAVLVGVVATGVIGIAVDSGSHSVSDTLYGAALPVLAVWLAVAALLAMSGRPSRMDGP